MTVIISPSCLRDWPASLSLFLIPNFFILITLLQWQTTRMRYGLLWSQRKFGYSLLVYSNGKEVESTVLSNNNWNTDDTYFNQSLNCILPLFPDNRIRSPSPPTLPLTHHLAMGQKDSTPWHLSLWWRQSRRKRTSLWRSSYVSVRQVVLTRDSVCLWFINKSVKKKERGGKEE